MALNQAVSVSDESDEGPTVALVVQPQRPSHASITFGWGRARLEAKVDLTPTALLAIGGMVGMILLSVAPIVKAAGKARRVR